MNVPNPYYRWLVERSSIIWLTNYWIYRKRLGLPTYTLDDTLRGEWPQTRKRNLPLHCEMDTRGRDRNTSKRGDRTLLLVARDLKLLDSDLLAHVNLHSVWNAPLSG